jgi:hypothetical protein
MADNDTRVERIPGPLVVSTVNPRYTGISDPAPSETAGPFTVELDPATYTTQWFSLTTFAMRSGGCDRGRPVG